MVKRVAKIRSRPVKTGPKVIPIGAKINCADNTGARTLKIVSILHRKGRHRRLSAAGVGDMVNCKVIRGAQKLKGEVIQAIIIRQKKEYLRPSGERIRFEDNAAILCTADGDLKGTEIKGPVAREASAKWPGIAGAGAMVV